MRTHLLVSLFLLVTMSCNGDLSSDNNYPTSWWEDPKGVTKEDWEIFPSEAKYPNVILSKRNELGILSNFAATPVVIDGKEYPCVEAFWQMLKFPEDINDKDDPRNKEPWQYTRDQVASQSGRSAKKMGDYANEKMKKLGIDWVSYKGKRISLFVPEKGLFYRLIYHVLVEKVKQNKNVHEILTRTGKLNLLPDHKMNPNSPPAWKYNEIYMDIRSKLPKVLEEDPLLSTQSKEHGHKNAL